MLQRTGTRIKRWFTVLPYADTARIFGKPLLTKPHRHFRRLGFYVHFQRPDVALAPALDDTQPLTYRRTIDEIIADEAAENGQ